MLAFEKSSSEIHPSFVQRLKERLLVLLMIRIQRRSLLPLRGRWMLSLACAHSQMNSSMSGIVNNVSRSFKNAIAHAKEIMNSGSQDIPQPQCGGHTRITRSKMTIVA